MTHIQFPYNEHPAPGTSNSIRPGIDWVTLPLPFALNHVNCWILTGDEERCVIDTGVNTSDVMSCWHQLFDGNRFPDTCLVTHFHPDHSGLSGWFAANGAQLVATETEWNMVNKLFTISDDAFQNYYANWYAANGVDEKYVAAVKRMGNHFKSKSHAPAEQCKYVQDGDSLHLAGRRYTVMLGQGHAPAMIMLYCEEEQLLIAADQVLPSITPNISLMPGGVDDNPLSSFLNCIDRLKALPEQTLVLPSHGLPFVGLHSRIEQMVQHHQDRLGEILENLTTPNHAASLFKLLFRRELDHQQLSFALGETIAHLKYLEERQQVVRSVLSGVDYFQTAG